MCDGSLCPLLLKLEYADASRPRVHVLLIFGSGALSFESNVGRQILVDNGMIDVSNEVRLDDFATMAALLKKNGPLGLGGNYGFFNTQGHFVVVAGWDTTNETLLIVDPAWAHGKDWKPFSYLKHTWTIIGDTGAPAAGSIVSRKPI